VLLEVFEPGPERPEKILTYYGLPANET
jgi:hypothetical protein